MKTREEPMTDIAKTAVEGKEKGIRLLRKEEETDEDCIYIEGKKKLKTKKINIVNKLV